MSAYLRRSAPHMLAAFVLMGGWALFANRAHPLAQMLLAGLVQGSLSACITLGMKRAIEGMVAQLEGMAARVLPPLVCGLVSISLLSLIHRLAGTPEALATIAVPVSVATAYAALYTQTLVRQRRSTP